MICSMETGYSASAIAISPELTLLSNSSNPLKPPTKSIRLSDRKSFIPRILSRISREDISTSRLPIGFVGSKVDGLAVSKYHCPDCR